MPSQNDPGSAVNDEHQTRISASYANRRFVPLIIVAVTAVLCSTPAIAQWKGDSTFFGWSERKLTAVVLSTIIPGAGQSYLGHSTKGAVLTIGAFGCGLMSALSENNVIGRNERLHELESLYDQSNEWEISHSLWNQMTQTKQILDRDVKRRDLYLKLTAVFWAVSVMDIVLLSEDLGQEVFGDAGAAPRASVALRTVQNGGIEATFTYRF